MGNKIVLKLFIFYKLIGHTDENCVSPNNFWLLCYAFLIQYAEYVKYTLKSK